MSGDLQIVRRVDHVTIAFKDVTRPLRFLTDTLGLPIAAMIACGDTAISTASTFASLRTPGVRKRFATGRRVRSGTTRSAYQFGNGSQLVGESGLELISPGRAPTRR